MKASNYNFFYEKDDEYLAYNSRSNALAVITKSDFEKYDDYVKFGKQIEDEELVRSLKEGFFLIDDNVDELKILRFEMYRDRMDENTLSLTIAPTSNCNFRCIYCYEKESIRNKSMTKEIEDAIVNFIEQLKDDISSLSIAWYGGEPLMRFDIIERLSKKIIRLCKENDIKYFSSIVTNGYLLNEEMAKKINDCNISKIQITIDGPQEIHDERRILANGDGTFEKILNNIIKYKRILPPIDLRINVDKTNVDQIKELYNILKDNDLLEIINPYLGHVKSSNGCYKDEKCISVEDYSKITFDFQELIKRNIYTFYPIRRTSLCGADSLYSFVIDSDGELYKCWDDIGIKEKSAGNILNGTYVNMVNVNYMTLDATQNEKCRTCKYLPICMGGCPVHFAEQDNCTYFKYNFDKYLRKVAEELENK